MKIKRTYYLTETGEAMPTRQYDRGFWSGFVFGELICEYVSPGDTVVFWAGRDYRDGLAERLERYGCEVHAPLAGLGIGQQKAALAELLRQAREREELAG